MLLVGLVGCIAHICVMEAKLRPIEAQTARQVVLTGHQVVLVADP